MPTLVSHHHPGRAHIEQFDTPDSERVQKIRDIKLGDQGVGQLDERRGHGLFP